MVGRHSWFVGGGADQVYGRLLIELESFPDVKVELLYLEVKISMRSDKLPMEGKSGGM